MVYTVNVTSDKILYNQIQVVQLYQRLNISAMLQNMLDGKVLIKIQQISFLTFTFLTGITTEECLYIDGCPTPQGCMLPADISSVRVRSATIDNPGSLSERERYGQPICQPFDMNMNNPKLL